MKVKFYYTLMKGQMTLRFLQNKENELKKLSCLRYSEQY